MSAALPSLPEGISALIFCFCSSVRAAVMSVAMNPGATALTVMPRDATYFESDLVKPMMQELDAE